VAEVADLSRRFQPLKMLITRGGRMMIIMVMVMMSEWRRRMVEEEELMINPITSHGLTVACVTSVTSSVDERSMLSPPGKPSRSRLNRAVEKLGGRPDHTKPPTEESLQVGEPFKKRCGNETDQDVLSVVYG
jgi:hypothetical protein